MALWYGQWWPPPRGLRPHAVPPRSAGTRAPVPTARHCWPVPLQETLKHSKAGLAQSLVGITAPFPGVHKGFVCALWASLVGMAIDSKWDFAPPTILSGLLRCPWTHVIFFWWDPTFSCQWLFSSYLWFQCSHRRRWAHIILLCQLKSWSINIRPSCLSLVSFGTLHLVGCTFPFLPCFSFLFFLQLFVKPSQIITLPSCFSFSLGWYWLLPPIQYYRPLSIVLQAYC